MKNNQNGIIFPVINTINSILSLSQSKSNNTIDNDNIKNCFKVLVLDTTSLQILSPLLKQSNLNKNNICLTVNISENKEKVKNAMAIYLISPTMNNITKIINDINENIYDCYSLNFIDIINEELLQNLITKLIQTGKINKIYNLNLFPITFRIFHSNIFDLNFNYPFKTLNKRNTTEIENENYINDTAKGLFSILFNMKVVPKIVYNKNDFTEEIVLKIKNEFLSTFNKFSDIKNEYEFNPNKTMLIILNRENDIPIMFHHSSSLGGIINDLYELSFTENKDNFVIDPINDFIWNKNIHEVFYELTDKTITDYKKYYNEMNQFNVNDKTKLSPEEIAKDSEKLSTTLENFNEKKIKGDILGKHAQIFTKINTILETKNLAELFFIEDLLLRKRNNNNEITKKINDFANKINANNSFDFFRLCLMYYIICQDISMDTIIKLMGKYYDKNKMENILKYFQIKKNKNIDNKKDDASSNFAKKLLKKSFMYVVNSFNTLMTVEQPSIIADIVNSILDGKIDNKNFDTLNLYDSFFNNKNNNDYQTVFVYIIGGGSLNEYEHIYNLLSKRNINIIYGCDKLYRPNDFIQEIYETKNS